MTDELNPQDEEDVVDFCAMLDDVAIGDLDQLIAADLPDEWRETVKSYKAEWERKEAGGESKAPAPEIHDLDADVLAGDGLTVFMLADREYSATITKQATPAMKEGGEVVDQVTDLTIEIEVSPADLRQSQFFNCAFIVMDIESAGLQGRIDGDYEKSRDNLTALPNPGGAQAIPSMTNGKYVPELCLADEHPDGWFVLPAESISWKTIVPERDKSKTAPMATLLLILNDIPHKWAGRFKWLCRRWMIRFRPKAADQANVEFVTNSKRTNPDQVTLDEACDEEGESIDETDELFYKAVRLVRDSRNASTSKLQHALKIGYNRAATIMAQLEDEGIVSTPDEKGQRTVLIAADDTSYDEPTTEDE